MQVLATAGSFLETDLSKEMEMIHVNIRAMHFLMKQMLCQMEKQGEGSILNVASSAGLFPPGPIWRLIMQRNLTSQV